MPFLFFMLAMAVNLLLLKGHHCIEEDGVAYASAGIRFFKGLGFSGIYPPGYPLLIGLFNKMFVDVELAARLVSVLFGSLMMFPLFYLARWAFGRKVAVICCCLALIYPNLSEYTPAALSESTFLFFFLLGVLVTGAAFCREKLFLYFLSGVIWGLAFLTRPEGLGYLVLVLGILAYRWIRSKTAKYPICMAVFIAGFFMMAFPYILNQKHQTGHWSLGNKTNMNFVLGENVGGREDWGAAFEKCYFSLSEDGTKVAYERMLEEPAGTFSYIMSHKMDLACRYIINLHLMNKYVIPGLFYPLIIVLFSAGLLLGNVADTRRASVLFLSFLPYLAFPLFIVAPRYFIYFVPIILIWSARGVIEIAVLISGCSDNPSASSPGFLVRQRAVEVVTVAVVIASFIPFTFKSVIWGDRYLSVYRDVGAWMKSNLPADSKIMARKPWVPFYAGMEQVALPFEPWDRIQKYAKYRGADYLVADQKVIGSRDAVKFLFDEIVSSKDVRRIYGVKGPDGNSIIIYQMVH